MSDHCPQNPELSDARLLLALDQELEPQEIAVIVAHVEQCAECRAKWERWKAVSSSIVEYHAALRTEMTPAERAGRNVWPPVIGACAAIAAVVLIAVYLGESRQRAPVTKKQAATTAHAATTAPVLAITTASAKPRRHARRSPAVQVASFIALPFSDSSLPLGDATIVRVELSVDELRLAGVAVDGEQADARIQADLLMGLDGLPRGIRFIQQ